MKRKNFLMILMIPSLMMSAMGQTTSLDLTFTAVDSITWVQLDSIRVMNRTQGGDTVLYWPDTVLTIHYVGISEPGDDLNGFRVFQNHPNPVTEQTSILLYIPDKDRVSMLVTDLTGRVAFRYERVLDKGMHSMRFIPGSGNLHFFTAGWRGKTGSIKILMAGAGGSGKASLEYAGNAEYLPEQKAMHAVQAFSYAPGDELLYTGHDNGLESGMLDIPEESRTYTFQFATNILCPGSPVVEYEGYEYKTIQIFNQCWLNENLKAGTMISGTEEMSDDGIIEKYCYNDDPALCSGYGGLYQWDEAMQYATQQGSRGICPPGWHVPSDDEWKILEGMVDSQYGIGDPLWNTIAYRGHDVGTNLRSTFGWFGGTGTNLYGFTALPGGVRGEDGSFGGAVYSGTCWTSTQSDMENAWQHGIGYANTGVYRGYVIKERGFSVRCLRDE